MVDKLLSDRQDVQIWSAIEAGNFKQALKLVDKRLAKKRTSHLEVRVNGEESLQIKTPMLCTDFNIAFSRDLCLLSFKQS